MALDLKLMAYSYFILCSLPLNEGLTCDRIAPCKCQMSDGSGTINLASLANRSGEPAYFVIDDVGGYWSYQYNPCIPFTSGLFTDLAILQVEAKDSEHQFNLGVQRSETFTYSAASGVSIKYNDDPSSPVRNSSVLLLCNSASIGHKLEFVGELITTEYEFIFDGPCACPGGCDDNGVIVSTTTTKPATTATKTTTATKATATTKSSAKDQLVEPPFDWNHLSNVLAGLIFHDFILVFIIAVVIITAKRIYNFDICSAGQYAPKRLSEKS